jgi:Bacterial Ig-like domain
MVHQRVGSGSQPPVRSRPRRPLAVIVALALTAAGLLIAPRPVAAANTLPWRFTTVVDHTSIPGAAGTGWVKGWVETCPAGYYAVSGGFTQIDANPPGVETSLSYPDPGTGSWHIVAWNGFASGTNLTITVNCVWAANVGPITLVEADFGSNSHQTGGETDCPLGTYLLSAGVDWSNTDQTRTIQFSAPLAGDGVHADAWYAAGSDPTAGSLHVELQCVGASLLTSEYLTTNDNTGSGPGYGSVTAQCASGYRTLTGGAIPTIANAGVAQGYQSVSGPLDPRDWPTRGYQQSGVTLRAVAVCVPASTVSLSWTQAPAALSTLRTGTITFLATDTAGETVGVSCTIDLVATSCTNGSPVGYNLVDGSHTLKVTATNQSGYSHDFFFTWMIDATAPTIVSHSPTSDLPLAGPMAITFSEAVGGVSGSSVTVHDDTANLAVAGTVGTPTASTATWTPTTNLAAGHTYRFSFSTAIHDTAGNQLTATFFTVNAAPDVTAPTIQSHSPATGLALTGPISITFSEPVTGVSGSSVTVHAMSANVNVAGTISTPTTNTATWTPSSSLVPGETYRVSLTSAIQDTSGNPLAATSFDVRTATSVENALFREYWDRDASSLASGGSYISSSLSGSKADLTFTATAGQTVAIYGIRLPSGGYADVYLDGVKKATASFYASSTTRARVYLSAALTAGTHTISIRPLGTKPTASSGTWVGIDNALSGATVKQESSFRQAFRRSSSASASGGSYDTMIHKIDSDSNVPKMEVTLVGTGVKIYATKTTASGSARIYVDGVLKATVSLHASATTYQALIYSGTFTLGKHVIRVAAVGTSTGSTSSVGIDRVLAI